MNKISSYISNSNIELNTFKAFKYNAFKCDTSNPVDTCKSIQNAKLSGVHTFNYIVRTKFEYTLKPDYKTGLGVESVL